MNDSSLRKNPLGFNHDAAPSANTPVNTTASPHPDHLAPSNDFSKDTVAAPPKVEGARGFGGA